MTSGTPWKTLTRASSEIYVPGDVISLNKGDTWTGEGFAAIGSGAFAQGTFDSTYSSTYSTRLALYTGDGTLSGYTSVLVADGVASGTAASIAGDYIAHLAKADAMQAAFAAADAASTYITLTSYGSGAHPKISPGGSIYGGIEWGRTVRWTGGWKIIGIDFDSCNVSGILYDPGPRAPTSGGSDTPSAVGLWIDTCSFSNCTGMAVKNSGQPYPGLVDPYLQYCATAISTVKVSYVRVKDVTISATVDSPWQIFAGAYTWISGATCNGSTISSPNMAGIGNIALTTITPFTRLLMENCVFDAMCNPTGFYKGESGPLFANASEIIMRNVEIKNTNIVHADGVPVDFEGHGPDFTTGIYAPWTGLFLSCNWHNNHGAGMLHNDTVFQASTRLIFDQCLMTSNGTTGLPAVLGSRTIGDQFVFTRNTVTKVSTQKLFGGDATHVYSPLYDAPPTGKIFGASNTVI